MNQELTCNKSNSSPELIHLDEIATLMINLILQSAYMKPFRSPQYKPLSLLLIGIAGLGKSRLLQTVRKVKFVTYLDDATPTYLVKFLEKAKTGKKRFLVFPDFLNLTTSHGQKTKGTSMAILRSMIEDGITDLSDFGLKFESKFPVKAGLITATTIGSFQEFMEHWKTTGFLSRLIPFSFTHSTATQTEIISNLENKIQDTLRNHKYIINKNPQPVKTSPILLHQLSVYGEVLGVKTRAMPYRADIQLHTLAEALAIIEGSSVLRQKHVDRIVELLHYVNYDFNDI
jgi:hypothetical protein